VLIAATCSAVLLMFNDGSLLSNTARFGFVRCLTGFFCGVVVWHAYTALKAVKGLTMRPTILTGVSVVLLAMWVVLMKFGFGSRWEFVMLVVICGLVLSIALNEQGPLARLLGSKPLVGLGRISYSVYMSHIAVLWVFSQLLRFVFEVPIVANDHGTLTYQTGPLMGSMLLLAYIAAVLGVSRLCFVHIEEVFRRRSKEWFRRSA
jgi:peptidoglycan/LPS O-acetylase OafA/YrhL